MASQQIMRITLKAYDRKLIDQSAAKIIETVKKTGSNVSEASTTTNKNRKGYNT